MRSKNCLLRFEVFGILKRRSEMQGTCLLGQRGLSNVVCQLVYTQLHRGLRWTAEKRSERSEREGVLETKCMRVLSNLEGGLVKHVPARNLGGCFQVAS